MVEGPADETLPEALNDCIAQFLTQLSWSSLRWFSLLSSQQGDSGHPNAEQQLPADGPGGISALQATCTIQRVVLRTIVGHLELLCNRAIAATGFRMLVISGKIDAAG